MCVCASVCIYLCVKRVLTVLALHKDVIDIVTDRRLMRVFKSDLSCPCVRYHHKLDAIGWYNTSDRCGCLYTCRGVGAVAAAVTLATTLSWPEMKNEVACAAMSHFGSSLFLPPYKPYKMVGNKVISLHALTCL